MVERGGGLGDGVGVLCITSLKMQASTRCQQRKLEGSGVRDVDGILVKHE